MISSITMTTPIADPTAALMLTHLAVDSDGRIGTHGPARSRRRRFQRYAGLRRRFA